MTVEIFDHAFYEERGKPEGSRGSVPLPNSVPTGHRANFDGHYSFGSTSELATAPVWLIRAREKALADFLLSQEQ